MSSWIILVKSMRTMNNLVASHCMLWKLMSLTTITSNDSCLDNIVSVVEGIIIVQVIYEVNRRIERDLRSD